MQNFLFRKNSHSASVVAKALPRPPESPPSPAPVRGSGSGSVSRIRRTAGGSPHRTDRPPKDRGTPKQRRENARKPECRDANGPRHRRNAPRQAGMPLRRRTKPQDAAICRSPSDVWADRASERIRRFAAECRSDTSQSSCKSVGRGRMLSAASENPPPRPRSSGGRDHAPARLPRRSGEEADGSVFRPRPEAATPCGKTGTVGRMCKPLTRTGQKTSGPIRTPRPARHRAGYDTHPIHGRLRTPGKPAQAATSPAQRASGTETTYRTQRNSSPTTSLSPTSSHAESALTAPRRTPSARSAATNRTTRSVLSAPQPRRLQCPQPCRIRRSQPPGRIRRP